MSAGPILPMGLAIGAGVGVLMVGSKLAQMQAESKGRAKAEQGSPDLDWLRAALKSKFAHALEARREVLAIFMRHAPQRTINHTSKLVECDLRARADEFATVLVIPKGEADLAELASVVLRQTMTAKVLEWGSSSRWIYRLEESIQLECQKLAKCLVLAVEEAVVEAVAQRLLGNGA